LYKESASSFYDDFIPKLKAYAEMNKLNYEEIRIVFDFDS